MRKKKWVHLLTDFVVLLILIGLDQMTKYYATIMLKGKADRSLIKNVIDLHYLENRGAAFGILQDQNLFFIMVGFVACSLCFYILWKIPVKKRYLKFQIFLVMLSAGSIGNMIDRFRYQYVVDFIFVSLIHFPVFNVADIFVTISAVGLILLFLFVYKDTDFGFLSLKTKKYRDLEDRK